MKSATVFLHDSSSEEKEKVAETLRMCYGKKVGFGSQPMKNRGSIISTGFSIL